MGGALKSAKGGFDGIVGQENPNATVWMLDGKRVPQGTEGAREVTDPWHGLSMRNRLVRGLIGGVSAGLDHQGGMHMTWGGGHAPTYTFGEDDFPITWQPRAGAQIPAPLGSSPNADLPDAPEPNNLAWQPNRRLNNAFYGR